MGVLPQQADGRALQARGDGHAVKVAPVQRPLDLRCRLLPWRGCRCFGVLLVEVGVVSVKGRRRERRKERKEREKDVPVPTMCGTDGTRSAEGSSTCSTLLYMNTTVEETKCQGTETTDCRGSRDMLIAHCSSRDAVEKRKQQSKIQIRWEGSGSARYSGHDGSRAVRSCVQSKVRGV